MKDEADEDISSLFDVAFTFMTDAVQRGQRILVHCKMGKSRSATLVAMYLMRADKMSLITALSHSEFYSDS